MGNLEPKKNALLRILQILQRHSDYDHPLTHEAIIKRLARDYDIKIERKAVGRNITHLQEAGFDIEETKHGCYLAYREFDDSELRLLIDGVLASRHITAEHAKQLIEKLCNLSNEYFSSNVKNIYAADHLSRSDNPQFFYNISLVDEAIETEKQITFTYNRYGADRKLHETAQHTVSPYRLILRNQHYFLMAKSDRRENVTFYRLDKITQMEVTQKPLVPLRSVEGFENGIDYSELVFGLPYMFPDKFERIVLLAEEDMADHIVDWFGDKARMARVDGKLKITLNASPTAMEYWAMQYLKRVEVVSPPALRERIKKNLEAALQKYE